MPIWFDKPAANWNEALPIGNGRLGAMVFGGVPSEHLQLNDDTLYSGEPGDRDLPIDVAKNLGQVREWLHEGKYAEVHRWITKNWLGRAQDCYEPLGDLLLKFPAGGAVTNYRRELDLADAMVHETYEQGGVVFTRDIFASHPAQAIIIRLHASKAGALNFSATLDSVHPTSKTVALAGEPELSMKGQVPGFALRRALQIVEKNGDAWKYPEIFDQDGQLKPGAKTVLYGDEDGGRGTRFNARLLVQKTDGQLVPGTAGAPSLSIENASDAVLIVTTGSSFNGFDKSPSREGKDEAAEAQTALAAAARQSFDQLREDHLSDYHALFNRVTLSLGAPTAQSELTTPERIEKYAQGGDEALAALYYQFGRYLMISGSRPGGQPLNLQGMWNPDVIPPWAGAYTLNINLEMNYWPAEVANLDECEEPLLRMIGELSINGRKVAHNMYGLPGWVAHHNTTIWRDAEPVDNDAGPAFWDMAGPWLCQHLWKHYEFTGDTGFLRDQAYPVMKGAAEFMAAWLVEDAQGHLVTPVGTSPENLFLYTDASGKTKSAGLIPGPTMDIALIRDLFTHCVQASKLLGVDEDFRKELEAKLSRLPPYQIGAGNRLQEWPIDFADQEPTHRHVSHLWGFFPGDQITLRGTPDLAAAAKKTLELRGDLATGWSLAWKINLWAHLDDGDHAHKCLALLLSPQRSYPNLFDSCPPFQIDGNFGAESGIEEMLLQSNADGIELLPALPQVWPDGKFTGLRAIGGYQIDCEWKNGHLLRAEISNTRAATCHLRYGDKVVVLSVSAGQPVKLDGNLNRFERGVMSHKNYPLKVGLFGIGLEAYWPQFGGLKERLEGYLSNVAGKLGRADIEVVDLGLIDSPGKALDAGHRFRQADVDILFLYVTTYALSSTVLPVVQRARVPVILLNLQPAPAIDYGSFNQSGDRTRMTGDWLAYCSACPVPEIANVFNRARIPFHQVTGVLENDPVCWKEIHDWVEAARVAHVMFHNRLGLMGHYYNGMLDIYTDLTRQCAYFGGHMEIIEVEELAALRGEVAKHKIGDRVALFHQSFDVQPDCSLEELERAARTSVALDQLVERHQLGSLAYYHMGTGSPENEDAISSIIIGNSLLTARGIPVAGEYEVKNVQAMKILDTLGAGGSFTEYYAMDFNEDIVLMGHDGPGHIAIAQGRTKVRPLGVYHGKVGRGLSVEMSVKHGAVTLLSVVETVDGKLKFLVAEGESVPGPILEIGNTNSRYKFSIGARGFVNEWNRHGPAHHCAVGIGQVFDKINKLGSLLGIEVVRVC